MGYGNLSFMTEKQEQFEDLSAHLQAELQTNADKFYGDTASGGDNPEAYAQMIKIALELNSINPNTVDGVGEFIPNYAKTLLAVQGIPDKTLQLTDTDVRIDQNQGKVIVYFKIQDKFDPKDPNIKKSIIERSIEIKISDDLLGRIKYKKETENKEWLLEKESRKKRELEMYQRLLPFAQTHSEGRLTREDWKEQNIESVLGVINDFPEGFYWTISSENNKIRISVWSKNGLIDLAELTQ
jgi:hypothetical protein